MPQENASSLFHAAGKLKEIKRAGWVKKAKINDAESVADHSFRTALIGAFLAEEMGYNASKIIEMCLIHDLAESKIGDITPEDKVSEKDHRMMEDAAIKEILQTLPKKSRNKFSDIWAELLENKSAEAKLVWQIDKLEMGLQMKDYAASGVPSKLLEEFDPSRLLSAELKQTLQDY